MSNFIKKTNKSGAISAALVIGGVISFLLWVFLDNSDSAGNWIDVMPWVGVGFFVAFAIYGLSFSGRKGQQ